MVQLIRISFGTLIQKRVFEIGNRVIKQLSEY